MVSGQATAIPAPGSISAGPAETEGRRIRVGRWCSKFLRGPGEALTRAPRCLTERCDDSRRFPRSARRRRLPRLHNGPGRRDARHDPGLPSRYRRGRPDHPAPLRRWSPPLLPLPAPHRRPRPGTGRPRNPNRGRLPHRRARRPARRGTSHQRRIPRRRIREPAGRPLRQPGSQTRPELPGPRRPDGGRVAPRAVRKITGTSEPPLRIRRSASNPSPSGIITSSRTRSGRDDTPTAPPRRR